MFDSATHADPQGWLLPSAEALDLWWVASQRADESAALEWPCPGSGEGDGGLPEHTAMPVDWFGVTDRADPRLTGAQLAADWAATQALLAGPGGAAGSLLASVEVADLSGCGRLDFLAASERQASWLAARQSQVLVAHVGTDHRRDTGTGIGGDPVSPHAYSPMAELHQAAALAGRLADTGAALEAGLLSPWGATVIAEAVDPLSDDDAAQVQRRVLAKVVATAPGDDDTTGVTVAQLRRWLRAAVATVDPTAAARRHQTGVSERGVQRWALPDGLARLVVTSAAHDVDVMHQALTVLAGPDDAEDSRSRGARRVDALLGLCLAAVIPATSHTDSDTGSALGSALGSDTSQLPARPVTPVSAQIVIDLATLCGLADNACELRGYGTIPATIARSWLANATNWRRLVTDPVSGHLLDAGPVVRFAPDQLRAFVVARDQTCTFPGCHQPANRADLDHHPPWQPNGTGGSTSAQTMAALCRRHHRLRTHARWTITQRQHGTTTWASPSGRGYTTTPPPVLPD